MADWSLPVLSSLYTDMLDELKTRDDDAAKMFDGVGTNLPTGTIRWSTANTRFEKWSGTAWGVLSTIYSINVSQLNGTSVNDSGLGTTVLWTSSKIQDKLDTTVASSATKLETARTIGINGDVTSTPVAFDGTSNITITVSVVDDSHNHVISNVDGLQTALDGKLSITGKAADSDKLDNLDSTQFLRSDVSDSYSGGILTVFNTAGASITSTTTQNGATIRQTTAGADATMAFTVDGDYTVNFGLDGGTNQLSVGGGSLGAVTYKLWHEGNDGPGSGLNADLFDNLDSTQFLRSDIADTMSAALSFTSAGTGQISHLNPTDSSPVEIGFENEYLRYRFGSTATTLGIRLDHYDTPKVYLNRTGASNFIDGLQVNSNEVWHSGNASVANTVLGALVTGVLI